MRKSRFYIIAMLLILVLTSVAIVVTNKKSGANTMNATLYYFNSDASTIVACPQNIDYENRSELFRNVLTALIKGPDDKKHSPIMNKNVKINNLRTAEKTVYIDFSEEYSDSSILATYAVIKTMTQFPDIESAKITINGKQVLAEGALKGDEINLESDDDCLAGMNLYFANKKRTKLVREYRKISISDTQPVEQYIVSELIKGPKNENNSALLSSDTGVISVETTDGTCYVNFKQDFINKSVTNANTEKLIIYSLVNSLTEREHIKNVQFLIEGKKTERFGDMEISGLFFPDDMLVEVYDKTP